MKLNRTKAWRMAAHFDSLPMLDDSRECQDAYTVLKCGLIHQWQVCTETLGIHIQRWERDGQPYSTSKVMREDVYLNKHLWYFPTDSGFGSIHEATKHPLMEMWPSDTRMCFNDALRAIHDILGHCVADSGFGPIGEEKAWREHRTWFSGKALPAITNETRMQNSWVNFGPYSHLPAEERPYADQKVALAPKWACEI